MQLMLKGVHWLNRFIFWLLALFTAVMVAVVFSQVTFRFVLEKPLVWSEEVALYCLVWITFLGGALAARNRGFIGVDALVRKIPAVGRLRIEILVQFLSALFFLVLIIYGTQTTIIVAGQRAAATGISMAWVYAAVPVGGLLMFINSLAWLADYTKEAKSMG
ncbi:MAG: TRAP transporter small permease [Firmicutes bacterium]|nr:TRAP transporter small permease [Bacillota bacterium]